MSWYAPSTTYFNWNVRYASDTVILTHQLLILLYENFHNYFIKYQWCSCFDQISNRTVIRIRRNIERVKCEVILSEINFCSHFLCIIYQLFSFWLSFFSFLKRPNLTLTKKLLSWEVIHSWNYTHNAVISRLIIPDHPPVLLFVAVAPCTRNPRRDSIKEKEQDGKKWGIWYVRVWSPPIRYFLFLFFPLVVLYIAPSTNIFPDIFFFRT